jgi:hypothetical protein
LKCANGGGARAIFHWRQLKYEFIAGAETIRIPNEPDQTNYFVIYGKSFLVRSKSGHIKTTSSIRVLTAHHIEVYDEGGDAAA